MRASGPYLGLRCFPKEEPLPLLLSICDMYSAYVRRQPPHQKPPKWQECLYFFFVHVCGGWQCPPIVVIDTTCLTSAVNLRLPVAHDKQSAAMAAFSVVFCA